MAAAAARGSVKCAAGDSLLPQGTEPWLPTQERAQERDSRGQEVVVGHEKSCDGGWGIICIPCRRLTI